MLAQYPRQYTSESACHCSAGIALGMFPGFCLLRQHFVLTVKAESGVLPPWKIDSRMF